VALADSLRSGIASANALLRAGQLLAAVDHYAVTGSNEYGEAELGLIPTVREAVVEDVNEVVRGLAGDEAIATVRITFLGAVSVNEKDRFVLPDDRTGRIVRIDRGVVATDGLPLVTVVYLG
jgi:hypothetical protein